LAFGAVFAGYIPFGSFVSADGKAIELPFHLTFSIAPVVAGLLGILIAYTLYAKKNEMPDRISNTLGGLYNWAYHKFYIDEIYLFITKKVLFNLIGRPAAWFDRNVVDGLINGTATVSAVTSESIKDIQSGRLQSYTMYFLGGVLFIAAVLIMKFL